MSYGDYLHLDAVLGAQHPLSPDHNEMLFIVQHQTSELWMKLMLHELRAAIARDRAPTSCSRAFKMLARVSRIMEQLVHAWDVLATMTPPEYSAIRPYLGSSQRLPELAVPLHRVRAGQQERRDAASRTRTGRSCWRRCRRPARAVALRRGAAAAGAARPAGAGDAHVERDWTQPYVAERRRRAGLARGLPRSRERTGTSTSSARSSPTWRTPSGSGASATSRRWSA